MEWSWPSRCYRLTCHLPGFEQCREVLCLLDGYPDLPGEPDYQPGPGASGQHTVPQNFPHPLQQWPDSLQSAMTCFTAVLVAPHEKILRAERDTLGGRTAYWHHRNKSFGISTSSSLLASLFDTHGAENENFMASMFAGHAEEPGQSAFSSIQEMLPGHALEFRDGARRTVRIGSDFDGKGTSPNDPVGQFREAFGQAVADALPGRGEKAAIMLSGGMDSGPMAALAKEKDDSKSTRPLIVSWKLTEFPAANEAHWIEAIADFLGLDREIFEASSLLPFSAFDTQHVTPDFPAYNAFRPLVLESYRHASRNGANIVLNASGGDMTYPYFNWVLYDQLSRTDFLGALKTLSNLVSRNRSAFRFARLNLRYLAARLLRGRRLPPRPPPAWLTRDAATEDSEFQPLRVQFSGYRHPQYAQNLLTSAHGTAHENAFSNRYGLDRRDPFQNPRIVDLMLDLPFSFSHRKGYDKWIMREAMQSTLPDEIRLKGRTGLLNSFFNSGFSRNKNAISEFLLAGHRDWESWVRRDYIEAALTGERTTPADQLVIARCIGYVLWRMTLKETNANGPR